MKLIPAFIRNNGSLPTLYPACSQSAADQGLSLRGPDGRIVIAGMQTRIDQEKIAYRDLSSPFLEITPVEKETLIKRAK